MYVAQSPLIDSICQQDLKYTCLQFNKCGRYVFIRDPDGNTGSNALNDEETYLYVIGTDNLRIQKFNIV